MLKFSGDNRTHQRGARAVVYFNFGGRADQTRIAIEHNNAIAFRSPRQLQCQSRGFWRRMLQRLRFFVMVMIVIMPMMLVVMLLNNRQ